MVLLVVGEVAGAAVGRHLLALEVVRVVRRWATVRVQPDLQTVSPMVDCVTSGLSAPGVSDQLARWAEGPFRRQQYLTEPVDGDNRSAAACCSIS